jgi:hypothetical protein
MLISPCISVCRSVEQPAEEYETGESVERGECDTGYLGRLCGPGDIISMSHMSLCNPRPARIAPALQISTYTG